MDIPGTSGTNSYTQWAHVIECPICYSIYDKPLQMGCGHTLCVGCVDRLVEQVKAAAADEGRNLPPQMPRIHFEENNVIVGLGGLNDQIEEQGWVEIPGIDQRNPGVVRGLIGFPPRRRADNESTEIKCPECRKPTVVPQGGLPVNYRVQEIVHKVAPLFKDRHLVKHCKQCDSVLNQGVYFDCGQCGEEGNKICSTCAIRLHNGHELVEKKALTSEDVVKMKKLINDASHRAFQSYENVKPRLENVGGVIEAKVKEKMSGLIKIFEFILAQFESKVNDTVTMDELMIDVKKAEDVAEAYDVARERIEVMLTSIEQAFDAYWEPFQQIRTLMEFEEPEAAAPAPAPAAPAAPAAAAPPAPAPAANPAPVQNPAPAQNLPNNFFELVNNMNNIPPEAAIRALQQQMRGGPQNGRAVAHFAQVDRQRNRVRMAVGGPPPNMRVQQIWGQWGPGPGPMGPGPRQMGPGHGQMGPGPGQMGPGPGQMGPMHNRQGPPRMMLQGGPQPHPMQIQHQQHQHQQQQQQQHHQQQHQQQQQQPPIDPAMMDFLQMQAQAQMQRHPQNMGPMPNGNMVRMNNGGNMPNLQQMQQHVPMPPQMPNFQQPQQQPPPQQHQQQRHPMPHEMGPIQRHPPMPPPNMGHMMHHHPGYQMRVQQQQAPPPPPPQQQPHFHNQGGVQAQQLHHQLQQLQQMQQEQQAILEQNEQQRMLQQQQQQQPQQQDQQQMQQMAEREVPEPREDIPRDPDWDNIPDNNAPQFEMQFDNQVEEEPINEEEIINNQNQNMVQQIVNHLGQAAENYRAGDINMIQFQEDNNAIRMVPIEDNNQQNIIMVQGDGLGDDGIPDDDDQNDGQENQDVDDEQDQFEDPEVPAFVEFQQQIHEDINALEANIQQVHIEQQQNVDLNQVHPILDIEPAHPVVDIEQIHDPVMQLDQFVQVVPVQQHQEGEENGLLNINLAGGGVQEEEIVVIEGEQPAQPAVTRRNQRRELVQEAETRRSVRRSVRNSTAPFEDTNAMPSTSEASTSTGVTARSLSPTNSVKRRKIDRRVKQELPDPEEMEAEEPVDPAPRPPKRRAAHMTSSSSSAGPSTSAPTTRSQTRS